jgi:hypothetical protein
MRTSGEWWLGVGRINIPMEPHDVAQAAAIQQHY